MGFFTWWKQRRCKHIYKKHWSRSAGQYGGYVRRCVKCGKIEDSGGAKECR